MALPAGADGLIAPGSKAASAGVILALAALAALALAGCGGGGGSDATTASAPGSGSSAAKSQGDSSSSSSSSGQEQGPESASDHAAKPNPAAGEPGSGSGKHGPSIPAPQGKRERGPTPAEEAQATVADIALWSPALQGPGGETSLPATYTCDGKDSWPQLRWRGVPADTKELALLAMSAAPVQGKLIFDWAVAGLDPSLEGLEAGRLPKGAISGQNSFGKEGYEICPDGAETYVFALFALPEALSPKPGFDPHDFREEVLGVSGNAGLLAVGYARG